MTNAELHSLHQLARLHGVQIGYYDVIARRPRRASPESLLAVLRALDAPVEGFRDVADALRARRQALERRTVEPVVAAWEGAAAELRLRLPPGSADTQAACSLELEDGDVRRWTSDLAALPGLEMSDAEGAGCAVKRLRLPAPLPRGYHRLRLEIQGRAFETLVIAAPLHAYPLPETETRTWGVFLPLYALRSERSPGGAGFSDLEALLEWGAGRGARLVGSLPLLASFLDEPFAPSPYTPVSGLFWNELYLDLSRIPELERAPAAQALLASRELRAERETVGAEPLVDYRRAMAWKRRVLEELAWGFFAEPGLRQAAFQAFVRANPAVEDYARFRAVCERRRASWPAWPEPLRDGAVREGDFDEKARRYHLYVQWQAHEQIQALAKRARQQGPGLYLDLPLGVHAAGYDVWRHRAAFALGAAAGAPPDELFVKGQNWRFPPVHPERIREQGYAYTIACLRHHLQPAGILRLDHVMSLHRLFWVPKGLEVKEGVYVRRRAEELYAILTLESHRSRTVIVGEDLGTVPRYVRLAMGRHKLLRSYVFQFQLTPDPGRAVLPAPADCLASLNTHDIRPFAGFWQGLDIQDRLELGLTDEAAAHRLRERRQALRHALVSYLQRDGWLRADPSDLQAILKACLAWLAASPARLVLLNLEDLWLETEPQNTPGTRDQRPNWRRKTRHTVEAFCQLPPLLDTLREVDEQRKRGSGR